MKSYWSKLLENGIILAVITGVAYLLTYLRVNGELAAYALPNEFIEIDAPEIIETMLDLVYKFWQVLIIPAVALIASKAFKDKDLIRLWRFSIVLITAVVLSVSLVGRFEPENWILLGIVLYEWAETLIRVLMHGDKHKRLSEKWASYKEKNEGTEAKADSRVALGIGYLAVIIAVMYVLSGAVIEHAANEVLSQEYFFVATDYDDKVVVFENGKLYALMQRDGDQLLPSYEIVRYDHIGKLEYTYTGVLNLPDGYSVTEDAFGE